MEKLALFTALVGPMIAFQLGFRYARPRRVWLVAIGLIVVAAAIAIWWEDKAFTRRSPYTFAPMVMVPALLACGVAYAGTKGRWPWPVTTIAGVVASAAVFFPMFVLGCVLAQAVGLRNVCRF
jgi:peptidoglycan/LPS O-acetylase OafA/YrhL